MPSAWYPDVVATDARLTALADLSARLESLPVDKALTHLVDTVDARLLPILAHGWHVTDLEGWRLADTVEKRRALLRRAIALHRKKGTPWAIRQALAQVGYDVEIIDQVEQRRRYAAFLPLKVDGSWRLDGGRTIRPIERLAAIPQIQHWAQFVARFNLADVAAYGQLELARALVTEWKPISRHPLWLLWLMLVASFDEMISSGWHFAARLPATRLYHWGNASLSTYTDAKWRLGKDGEPVCLPAAFGAFRVGELRGHVAGRLLREARARVGLSAGIPIFARMPRETIPPEPVPIVTPPVRLIDRLRRLDGRWRLHHARFHQPFGFHLTHATFRARQRFGFRLGAYVEMPPTRLTLSGNWRLGGPRNAEFTITRVN
jgi:phage tail P2-like protein